jgi:CheY-like chemotaxis protein
LLENVIVSDLDGDTLHYHASGLRCTVTAQLYHLRLHLQAAPSPLQGKRFLVVEDEPLIALEIVAGLERAGAEVAGPLGTVDESLATIDGGTFDAVLLDANLRGRPAGDIAAALTRRKVPFVFVTGYGREALPESFGQVSMLTKRFTQEQLVEAATQLIQPVSKTVRLRE